jgi:excisionase family DNA binding protein
MAQTIVLIDIKELARRLGVSTGGLYNKVHERRIPFFKIGGAVRFDYDEVIRTLPHFSMQTSYAEA